MSKWIYTTLELMWGMFFLGGIIGIGIGIFIGWMVK
jgi:hypothetical protein